MCGTNWEPFSFNRIDNVTTTALSKVKIFAPLRRVVDHDVENFTGFWNWTSRVGSPLK